MASAQQVRNVLLEEYRDLIVEDQDDGSAVVRESASAPAEAAETRTFPVSEVTIAGNLIEMFETLTPANDLEFRYGTNAPTMRVEGLTVAGR